MKVSENVYDLVGTAMQPPKVHAPVPSRCHQHRLFIISFVVFYFDFSLIGMRYAFCLPSKSQVVMSLQHESSLYVGAVLNIFSEIFKDV